MSDQVQRRSRIIWETMTSQCPGCQHHSVFSHEFGMLFYGGMHTLVLHFMARLFDIVISSYPDLACQPEHIQSLNCSQGHIVIGTENCICILIFLQQPAHH